MAAFAARQAAIEVHEWDLTEDPGPAAGLGIFATPALLVNGRQILMGVPTEDDLLRHAALAPEDRGRRVLVVNARGDALERAVFDGLTRAGYVPFRADSVADAVEALKRRLFEGVVVAFKPFVHPRGGSILNGVRLWAEVARRTDPAWTGRPIVFTIASGVVRAHVRSEIRRHRVTNPVVIVTRKEASDPSFPLALERLFSAGPGELRENTALRE